MFLKDKNYFNATRSELVELVKMGDNRVLDIGCGSGNTGAVLKKENKATEVIGIELVPEIAKIAESKIDKVICGNIEFLDLQFSKGYFDYVIAGDILEHLYNPWKMVNRINFYLKNGGYIIASLPNVRNWLIIRDIIFKGDWRYKKEGILDDTHLRFFTKKSIFEMFKNNKFSEIKILPRFKITKEKNKSNLINMLTFGIFEEFLAYQYIVIAKKYDLP